MPPNMYRDIHAEDFPKKLGITFYFDKEKKEILYEKVLWKGKGLRYGDNPDQSSALYRRISGPQAFSSSKDLQDTVPVLVQAGKHPSKNNITDIYSALRVLQYFPDTATTVIIKHGNPCGAALGKDAEEAFLSAHAADRIAAFGGVVVLNREVSAAIAAHIAQHFFEIVAAPCFSAEARKILARKKSLSLFETKIFPPSEMECVMLPDSSLLVQSVFQPKLLGKKNVHPAETSYKGVPYRIARSPSESEIRDMSFGWILQSAVTSNSVLFVKDQRSVGIATGEQDRVGAARIARDKAYRNAREELAFSCFNTSFAGLSRSVQTELSSEVELQHAGLKGSVMVSDGFFPFRDGIDVGLEEGVAAVLQPGGSIRDYESILACNEVGATMVFTEQRGFRH